MQCNIILQETINVKLNVYYNIFILINIMNQRTINCPIHGVITLTSRMCKIVDTPEFQRLHGLRQLGATHYVYPSASHTRFEHSLGVSHLAKILLISLKEKNPTLNISDNLIELYQVAGLIHDIGHGPFSHLYDDVIINPEEDLKHEDRGIIIFKKMIQTYSLDFSEEDMKFIIELIEPSSVNKNNWKYQIINNKFCSIDVDKIDYIRRDSYHLGFGINHTFERLLTMCDIKYLTGSTDVTQVLSWPEKLQDEVLSLFESRYRLHKRVYCHHTVKAVEYIIVELLREIKTHTNLNLAELTDDIILFPFANEIIKNLQRRLAFRAHPKLVGEKTIIIRQTPDSNGDETINNALSSILSLLNKHNILNNGILKTKIGFISGNGENPLINVPYFSKDNITAEKTADYSSFMTPTNCQEYIYRIYSENIDTIDKARDCWKCFL